MTITDSQTDSQTDGQPTYTIEEFWAEIRRRHPGFRLALKEDARVIAQSRGERYEFRSKLDLVIQILRLALQSDAFLGQAMYRGKARLQALGVPVLPRLLHHLAIATAQISIGDPVVIQPGVCIAHGQVVIDGPVEIATGVFIGPFVSIGLVAGDFRAPRIERNAFIGTGSRLLGGFTVGEGAQVGANAVVLGDVPSGSTVVGAPARAVRTRAEARSATGS